jgi:tRNA threonylcarbamoyladenosine biosynthesis protein TsaB
MRVLALDTATEACSAALLSESGVIGRYDEIGRGHAEQILDMVSAVLGEAGVPLSRLDGIAAGTGPGSFTGVRISVSVAQGLAFGASLPVVAVTSLEALAARVIEERAAGLEPAAAPEARLGVLACLDARMGEVYWGCFAADAVRGVKPLTALRVGSAAEVRFEAAGRYAGIGRGFDAYPELERMPGVIIAPHHSRALPNALHIAKLAAVRFAAGEGIDPALLKPEYVRDKVALTEAERLALK